MVSPDDEELTKEENSIIRKEEDLMRHRIFTVAVFVINPANNGKDFLVREVSVENGRFPSVEKVEEIFTLDIDSSFCRCICD